MFHQRWFANSFEVNLNAFEKITVLWMLTIESLFKEDIFTQAKLSHKEYVTLFCYGFFISPYAVLLILYESVRILYESILQRQMYLRIKHKGN